MHPILLGAYAILALLANNIGQIEGSSAARSLVMAVSLGILAVAAFWLLMRDLQSAGLVASALVLVFFSYGHVYELFKHAPGILATVGRHRVLIPMFAALIVGVFWGAFHGRAHLTSWTWVLNGVSVALVLLPLASITCYSFRQWRADNLASGTSTAPVDHLGSHSTDAFPDIYYIVVDTYAREDVLFDQYGYDNSTFITFLEDEGFYVARDSQANFLFTHLSLTSSLNMDYMQSVKPAYSQGDHLPIKDNFVRETLGAAGYSTVAFATGWNQTEWFDADYVFTPEMSSLSKLSEVGSLNRFETLLIPTTALKVVLDLDSLHSTPVAEYIHARLSDPFTFQRQIVLAEFENLKSVPQIQGPKFVFVHILPPHGPHLFDADGSPVESEGAFTLASKPGDQETSDDERYLAELQYVTKRLEETIDAILRASNRPVAIILQSDHGPAHNLDWDHPTERGLRSRISILNAYYLPENCQPLLYPSISPVNSFRVIERCVLGMNTPLLPDETYYGYDTYIPVEQILPRGSSAKGD